MSETSKLRQANDDEHFVCCKALQSIGYHGGAMLQKATVRTNWTSFLQVARKSTASWDRQKWDGTQPRARHQSHVHEHVLGVCASHGRVFSGKSPLSAGEVPSVL